MLTKIQKLPYCIFVVLACFGAAACTGSDSAPRTSVVLEKPFTDRQILAFENSTLRIEIMVNNGPLQSFTIFPGQNTLSVDIVGVRANENNSIDIKWIELLNGFDVEISDQSQTFFADGNTQIDAPHEASQFDYDEDGISNREERSNGGCVWSAEELCLIEGWLDVPTSPPPPEEPDDGLTALEATLDTTIRAPSFLFDFDNAMDIAINGDFSGGEGGWSTQGPMNLRPTLVAAGEDLCAIFPSDSEQIFNIVYYYDEVFDLIPGVRYAFVFDVRSSRESRIKFGLTRPLNPAFIDQPIAVDETSRTITITYEHTGDIGPGSSVGFSALNHPRVDTTYCIDNFMLYVEQ